METEKKPVVSVHETEISETETEQRIRARAFALYENRGREDGHDIDDWLQAEAELRPQLTRTVAA